MIKNIDSTFNISCVLKYDPSVIGVGSSEVVHLYRIIQEAIHNSIKHGKAKNIFVRLMDNDDSLTLSVHDDGVGFCPDQTDHKGMGLHIMKYRAKAIKGDLVIRNNSEKKGVTVECSVPNTTKELKNIN